MASKVKDTLRELLSRIEREHRGSSIGVGPGRPGTDTLFLGLLTLLPLAGVLACAYFAAHYAFWRPDTWAYLGSPHNEFEYNQRWLLPAFFYALRRIPQFAAWLVAVFLFGWLGYRVTRTYLAGSPFESRALSIGLASLCVIMPGFHSQLGWASHAMSATLLLAVMEALSRRLPRIPLVLVGTPIVYGLHQSFAPMTLLFLIPSYDRLCQQSLADNMRDTIKNLVVWAIAFALGWGLAETILRIAFGQIPVLSPYRHPHFAASLGGLLDNLVRNFALLGEDLGTLYYVTGIILMLLLVLTMLIWRARKSTQGGRPWIPMLAYSGALFLSIYVFTAPDGVDIPIRATLVFGPATLLLGLALLGLIQRPVPTLLAVYAFCFYPCMISIVNNQWSAEYSSDVRSAIVEISPADPGRFKGVIVLEGAAFDKDDGYGWPKDYAGSFEVFPQVFWPGRVLHPAFHEAGYRKTVECGTGAKGETGVCAQLDTLTPRFTHCATINPEICSAGATPDGYWLVRL
ncbi:MAG TPA: hypothetical protein VFK21_12765 [Gammaproteobacteria bacterium]|nr:hypothetical protein [Gammaproteobacteria bacterium]